MRIRRTFAVMALALTAVGVSSTSAGAASADRFTLTNVATGKCLVGEKSGADHLLATAACPRQHDDWELVRVNNVPLVRNVSIGKCLDGNTAGRIYLSDCTSADQGQHWFGTCSSHGYITHAVTNKQLTGWNDGRPTLRALNDVDNPDKQKWRLSALDSDCPNA